MKKILFSIFLVLGGFLSWSCNNSSTPSSPNGTSGRGAEVPTATPTTYPTVAATLSPTPAFISEWGSDAPNGLAQGNGFIYVAEGDGASVSQVQLLNNSTNLAVTQWTGYASTSFKVPVGVTVNQTTGSVYVLDEGIPNIQDTATSGSAVYEFGSTAAPTGTTAWSGYGGRPFEFPSGIALDSNGNVYVADSGNFEVEEFGSGGVTTGEWSDNNNNYFYPAAVALDASNNIYVVDAGNFLVWKLSSITGTPISWPIIPSDNLTSPFYGLAIDSNNNVFVADYTNNLVEVYSNSGTLIGEMNGQQTGSTPFAGPLAVLLFSGNIYVADYDSGAGNFQIFGPNSY